MRRIRSFLSLEAVVFGAAALVHTGVLVQGYAHREAATAEGVIGLVLLLGLAATVAMPAATRRLGLATQGFALAGTMVGLFTIVMGVGPQTAFDVALHAGMVALLLTGLTFAARSSAVGAPRGA